MTRRFKKNTAHGLRVARADLRKHGRLWLPLGATATGTAASITIISVFLPVILGRLTDSQTLIGFAVGGEGIFALALSLLVGPLSDRTRTRFGRRRPYMLTGLILASLSLALTPFMPGYWSTVIVVFFFFVGYYLLSTPYRALSTDVLAAHHYGRGQGYVQTLRAVGFVSGFILGTALFPIHEALPFIAAAAVLLVGGLITIAFVPEPKASSQPPPISSAFRELWQSWRRHPVLRRRLAVNFLFEFTLAGIRTFIILFFIQGLGLPLSWALVAVGIVAGANLVAAVGGGYLADHLGIRRVLRWSNLAYGLALLIPFFVSELWLVFTFLPVFAVVGAVIVTLGFPLVMEVTPRDKEGTYSALFELARGGGIVLGPVVTGAAIDIYARVFHGPYEGYPALWLVGGLATLLAWLLLRQERETTRPA